MSFEDTLIKKGDKFRCISYKYGGSEGDTWNGVVTEIDGGGGVFAQFTITWNNNRDDEIKVVPYTAEDLLEYMNKGVVWKDRRMADQLPEDLFTL